MRPDGDGDGSDDSPPVGAQLATGADPADYYALYSYVIRSIMRP
jgi:hypothetical protein